MTLKMVSKCIETARNEPSNLENVYIEPKIIEIGQCDGELGPFQCAAGLGSHFGGHLGF